VTMGATDKDQALKEAFEKGKSEKTMRENLGRREGRKVQGEKRGQKERQ